MRPAKIVLVVLGALAALVGFALTLAGSTLLWAHTTQRDDGGYYSTSRHRFESSTYAITSERIDLGTDVREGDWVRFDDVGTARIAAESTDGTPVFVGIARDADVERYLRNTAHDELVDVSFTPFFADYRRQEGEIRPAVPATQSFWVASATGAGRQVLTWDMEQGEWAVVIMNADASAGVGVDASVGVKTSLLLPIGIGVGGFGVILLVAATAMLILGLRREVAVSLTEEGAETAWTAPAPSIGAGAGTDRTYPARLDGHLDPGVSRWQWLFKWLLVIPHVVVLTFLWAATLVLTVVAGFAILFTGRYPRSIFDFNVGVFRWTWRVSFYALSGFATDRYPPFSLRSEPGYPADFSVDYPERLSRGLVLVKWWLLAIPHYLIVAIFAGGWGVGADEGWQIAGSGGLIAIVALVAAVVLTFTGRYPVELFDFVMGLNRWCYRVLAYAALMRDEYPPFRFDPGGTDPGSVTVPPPATPDRPDALVPAGSEG